MGHHLPAAANHIPGRGPPGRPRPPAPASTTQPTSHHDQAAIVKGQPYGACQTVTAPLPATGLHLGRLAPSLAPKRQKGIRYSYAELRPE